MGRVGKVAQRFLADSDSRQTSNVRGILAMLAAMAAFTLGDAAMKLMSTRLPTGETIFIRGVIACCLILPLARAMGALDDLRRRFSRPIALRTAVEVAATGFYQNGLVRLPFADVSAILQINPLVVTAAAAIFLGEKVGWRRWTATAIGLLGVLLIIRPGGATFQWASLLLIGATFCSCARDLVTRQLPVGTPILLLTSTTTVAVTLCSLAFLPFENWVWPPLVYCLALTIPALCMLAGQLLVIVSIRSGEVSAVVPFRYSAIVWALLLSVLIWQQWPDRLTLLGICIVTGAGLYTFHREQVRRREAAANRAAERDPPP